MDRAVKWNAAGGLIHWIEFIHLVLRDDTRRHETTAMLIDGNGNWVGTGLFCLFFCVRHAIGCQFLQVKSAAVASVFFDLFIRMPSKVFSQFPTGFGFGISCFWSVLFFSIGFANYSSDFHELWSENGHFHSFETSFVQLWSILDQFYQIFWNE